MPHGKLDDTVRAITTHEKLMTHKKYLDAVTMAQMGLKDYTVICTLIISCVKRVYIYLCQNTTHESWSIWPGMMISLMKSHINSHSQWDCLQVNTSDHKHMVITCIATSQQERWTANGSHHTENKTTVQP